MNPADPFDLAAYRAWRAEHPTRPLPRDVEEALVAEVERLRAWVAELRAHGVSLHKATAAGMDHERAAVVAYLRRETYPCCGQCNNELATYIERGEHRREENE